MELSKRIGDLTGLTNRLRRVTTQLNRLQSSLQRRTVLPSSTSYSSPGTAKGHAAAPVSSAQGDSLSLTLGPSHRNSTALDSRQAAHLASHQDQLLFRRVPIAVSLLERNWTKLDERQRAAQKAERQKTSTHLALTYAIPSPTSKAERSVDNLASPLDLMLLLNSDEDLTPPSVSGAIEKETNVVDRGLPPSRSEDILANRKEVDAVVGSSSSKVAGCSRTQLIAAETAIAQLHYLEEERRRNYTAKLLQAQRRVRGAQSALSRFRREKKTLSREAQSSLLSSPSSGSKNADANHHYIQETEVTLLQNATSARNDIDLLKSSLLARPYLSTRLWKLFLREPLWTTAVAVHHRSAAASPIDAARVAALLTLLMTFSRIVLGVLRDYVQGGQVNSKAPRFVVSLPSRRRRAEQLMPRLESNGDGEDLLLTVLQSSAAAPMPSSQATQQQRQPPLRWIPPHSAAVLPLVVDTLAMYALVLPELRLQELMQLGYTSDLVHLCVTLQYTANAALALCRDHPKDGGGGVAQHSAPALHRSLQSLEKTLIKIGHAAKERLATHLQEESLPHRCSPADAARLLLQLDSLRLLSLHDFKTRVILSAVVTYIFPQLRSRTSEVLLEKARQSSLLAFATKQHRAKLFVQNGRAGAESLLLNSVIQQARLQQRQMAAALRERALTEIHVQSLVRLCEELQRTDLVSLFQILSAHVCEASEDPLPGRGKASEGRVSTLLTGALFTGEALLVSGALAPHSSSAADFEISSIAVEEFAAVWRSTTVLWPLVAARRTRQLAQRGPGARSTGGKGNAHTERMVLTALAEHVLSCIAGHLAERLQGLPELSQQPAGRQGDSSALAEQRKNSKEGDGVSTISASHLFLLVSGLLEHTSSISNGTTHTLGSPIPASVQEKTRLMARLLRHLLFRDAALWAVLRQLPLEKRVSLEEQLIECFQGMEMLDNTTAQAVRSACSLL